MKKEQRVWLMGVPSHGQEVIKTLQKLGGENVYGLNGERDDDIYFINHEGIISSTIKDETGRLIMDFYREIKLPERWKDGDVLAGKYQEGVFAVFSKYRTDGDDFDTHLSASPFSIHKHIVTYVIDDFRLATPSETEHFHELLHKHGVDWDAERKKLVDWKWKPNDKEAYYTIEINRGKVEVRMRVCFNDDIDKELIKTCNCYRTEREAEAAAERVKKALKGE